VGDRGVLTCLHVVEPYLSAAGAAAGTADVALQVRSAGATSAGDWISCRVAWQPAVDGPAVDAVLLEITPGPGETWAVPALVSSPLAGLGQRPVDGTAAGFPDDVTRPSGLRDSEQAPGKLLPAGQARGPLLPFDVDVSVPDHAGVRCRTATAASSAWSPRPSRSASSAV
jgi:hypothetical protein